MLVAGVALVGTDGFIWIQFAVSILALIVCVFSVQAGHWWWLIAFVPIAIAWNPVLPLLFAGTIWQIAHFVVALVFLAAGVLVKVPNPEDRNRRR